MDPGSSHMLLVFASAVGGSLAVEIVNLYQLYQIEPFILPPRYRSGLFWLVRIVLSLIGGGLALAYKIDQPLLAANIGASAPLIVRAFTEGIRPRETMPSAAASLPLPSPVADKGD